MLEFSYTKEVSGEAANAAGTGHMPVTYEQPPPGKEKLLMLKKKSLAPGEDSDFVIGCTCGSGKHRYYCVRLFQILGSVVGLSSPVTIQHCRPEVLARKKRGPRFSARVGCCLAAVSRT